MRLILFLFMLACLAAASVNGADPSPADSGMADSLKEDSTRVIIRIERREQKIGSFVDTLDVTMQSTGQMAAGFDLKIGIANQYLSVLEVLPGEIYDSCGWDYFSARPLERTPRAGNPSVLWHAVGMAEGISNQEPAHCYGLGRPTSIARLVVSNQHLLKPVDTAVAIYFWWEDCTDNVVSGITGEHLYLSTNVLDYFPLPDSSLLQSFPTRRGAPKACQKPGSRNPAQRRVEFHNGGVRFSLPTTVIPTTDSAVKRESEADSTR